MGEISISPIFFLFILFVPTKTVTYKAEVAYTDTEVY